MSNKTFEEGQVGTMSGPGLQSAFSSGCHSSDSLPPSGTSTPDCSGSLSNLSDGDHSSSPVVNILDCCVIEDFPGHNSYITDTIACNSVVLTPSPNHNISDVTMNLNQMFRSAAANDSVNIWNGNISLAMSTPELGVPLKNQSANKDSKAAVTNHGSTEGDSPPDSSETSCSSSEHDCCSLSSGGMVMRRNSFCLEDETIPLFSSLEESPVLGSALLVTEASQLLPTLPDVCEGLPEKRSTGGVEVENTSPTCFGMTFIQPYDELFTNEKENATYDCHVSLPSETEAGHLRTFLCDSSLSDSAGRAQTSRETSANTDTCPHLNGTFNQGQRSDFVTPTSKEQDSGSNVQTSTPIQHKENSIFSVPLISESFSVIDSPIVCPAKGQLIPPTQRSIARLLPSSSKVTKTEIRQFPKPDYSVVKSKVMTKCTHPLAMSGSASAKTTQRKSSKVNTQGRLCQENRRAPIKMAHAKAVNTSAANSTATNAVIESPHEANIGANDLGKTFIQTDEPDLSTTRSVPDPLSTSEDGEGASRASLRDSISAGTKHGLSALCAQASPKSERTVPSQVVAATATLGPGNKTSIVTPPQKGHADPKQSPKKQEESNRNGVSSGSASHPNPHSFLKRRSRCFSDSSSSSSNRHPREKISNPSSSTSFSTPKAYIHPAQSKLGNLNSTVRDRQFNQADVKKVTPETSSREVKKISLVAEFTGAGAARSTCDESKSRHGVFPFSRQSRGTPAARPPAASPSQRPAPLSRLRPGSAARDGLGSSRPANSPQIKPRTTAAHSGVQPTEKPAMGAPSTTSSAKPPVNGFRIPHTPSRPSSIAPSSASAGFQPRKPPVTARSIPLKAGIRNEQTRGTGHSAQDSSGVLQRPSSVKTLVMKARLLAAPGRESGSPLATACKSSPSSNQASSRVTVNPLKRTAVYRTARLSSGLPVDSKPSVDSTRQHQPPPPPHQQRPTRSHGTPDLVPPEISGDYRAQCEKKDRVVQKLRELLAASNCKVEAFAVVLQQIVAERDAATKQRSELSQELAHLQGELVCSVHSGERLEKERDDLRVALEEALQKLQDRHQDELAALEQRLQSFYQSEWDKAHLTYQEEANRFKALMEQQMCELKSNHEAVKLELESSHSEQLQRVKQQNEDSLEELRKGHSEELQTLEKALRDAESALSGKIEDLTTENNALIEKVKAEEDRRRLIAERSQKDSHTLYLEQELESLKVVLDIKNKQLHQQENKIIQMDTLTDKNVKLDESLKKVQQENEDLKARMDRHSALSRQLSTEQVVLQESLHKESKVNKRLSMENEELLWKLHNGDLSSPRRISPTSHPLALQSPRSSALFSSPPASPR